MARKSMPTHETEKEIFPTRLRDLMSREPKTSQLTLAEYLGITRQAVSNYMTGQSSPDWKTLAKIATFFQVSADYLLGLSQTQSTNMTLQAACEYTKLTEETIIAIRNASNFEVNAFATFLDYAVKTTLFFDIGVLLVDCRSTRFCFEDFRKFYEEILQAQKNHEYSDELIDRVSEFESRTAHSALRFGYKMYEIALLFNKIMDNISQFNSTKKHVEYYAEQFSKIYREMTVGTLTEEEFRAIYEKEDN